MGFFTLSLDEKSSTLMVPYNILGRLIGHHVLCLAPLHKLVQTLTVLFDINTAQGARTTTQF
jgi:hypothetical protein